jgi:ribonuclease J
MNAYVYGYGKPGQERLILVDLGVTFPDMDGSPGVDLILPDISWLAERADRLEAIFVTHAHEDHVGAVALLWQRLKAPVYARPFTAEIARRKFEDAGLDPDEIRITDPNPHVVDAGPFIVSYLPVSHSVPESSGLIIDTPAGRVVHTGDFKLDETPVVGEPFSRAAWAQAAKPGVLALICDSTNVFSEHAGRSEATLADPITQLVSGAKGMVAATTFASNVARLKTLAEAGQRAGRSVCLMGRAMRRMVKAAVKTGVLSDFPSTVSPEDAADIPRENLMLVTTGSQGERRAATAQLSRGRFLGMELKEGDLFLFSSKTIPGNEKSVIRIINAMSEMGVDVVDDSSGYYHVSGHANRPDLGAMHDLMNPTMVIPMHGEHRHLRAHSNLARSRGFRSEIAVNGTVLELKAKGPKVVDFVETGRTYLDGTSQIGALDGIIRNRIRMALNGHVIVTLIMDEDGEPLGEPWVEIVGLAETGASNAPLAELIEADLDQFLGRAKASTLSDDTALEKELRRLARNTTQAEIGKKPEVTVVISRLA